MNSLKRTDVIIIEKGHDLFELFPNPSHNIVYFTLPAKAEWAISVTDAAGRSYATTRLNAKFGEIDVAKVPAGVYFISFISDSENRTFRVIIQR